ncbi:Calcium-binding EF-hand-containing protein [Lysobacter dokdonensis DS-58]|uniref:Calcium-binding EF-hand-containing protein n=1 Tax=Lysobacter dokdonensis DS-58 TaxID=1300345 RepID=A0A0A2WIP1_9GAMM|nr:EF-hand domain-containing protein [Lysobacter dokdonensis]KGQ18115.1 Calcium-binding EF-hand-containing protein [Lysobacter dokdonensis DS-58]
MNRSSLLGIVLFACATPCAFAQVPNTAPDATPRTNNPVPASVRLPQNGEQRMAAMDRNGDGALSEDEYEDAMRRAFRDLDADRNNRVSPDELASASAPQQDGMVSPADRIRSADLNTDGELTEEELVRGAEQAFDRLDTSNDDALDLGELKSGGG